jgi:hypothetical protein
MSRVSGDRYPRVVVLESRRQWQPAARLQMPLIVWSGLADRLSTTGSLSSL